MLLPLSAAFISSTLLSIEDPMYFESGIPVGWFYGTHEQDYRDATAKLVTSVARCLGIPNERLMKKGQENQADLVQHQKRGDNNDGLPAIGFLENIACEYDSEGAADNLAETLEVRRCERYRSADASALTVESVRIDSTLIGRVQDGGFYTEIDGAHFECFYHASEYDYLYVVLDTRATPPLS
jgi:hypothetical protein